MTINKELKNNINFSVLKDRTKYHYACWFISYLYVIFLIVCTCINFESDVTINVFGQEIKIENAENNLLQLWALITDGLKGWRLYLLLIGMGIVGVIIDFLLIKFLWGGVLNKSQRIINKQAKLEMEEYKQLQREKKEAMKELKALKESM